MNKRGLTADQVYTWLEEVKDPEIPVLSLPDLGVITNVTINGNDVAVEMTPTFVGCPALDMMKQEIREVLEAKGVGRVDIRVSFDKPWSSDLISEKGRQALKTFGIAPPPPQVIADIDILEHATCPRCDGTRTELRNTFGATLCRSMHYCYDCREAFEQFKPL